MPTTLSEFRRQVMISLPGFTDGHAAIVIDQAINDAHATIARVHDFDELIVLDTTHAATVISQKSYHIITDWGLTRPKDIFSIRYMDESNSRKLLFVPTSQLDEAIPYTEVTGTGRPTYYTRRGMNIELFRIPDAVKSLYIQYSQWPNILTEDTDQTPYLYIDDIIVALTIEITAARLAGMPNQDWILRAKKLLGLMARDEARTTDQLQTAQPFSATRNYASKGEYWNDPFYKG